mgnify:CR=1 FL=1
MIKQIDLLHQAGITVSLFVDPDLEQLKASARVKADYVEIHTGSYCDAKGKAKISELAKIEEAILNALEMTPPELSEDIYKTGIYLAGGGSMLRGLDYRISLNLIITCARHLEPETQEEITKILGEFGDDEPKITITNMSGILTAETNLDPINVVEKRQELILDEPWSIRYCLRIIPIQIVCDTKIEDIEEKISELIGSISEGESYRISIEKRNCDISSREMITKIANKIKNKVSLENPDKIIQIEILGGITGMAVLKKSDILSVEKTKRSLSD